jgi:tripartite-type tricarboxylate transporter receptor subunit TctC
MRTNWIAIAAACFVGATASAQAQSWPDRPVKLIVPTGPGAATDVMARLMAEDAGRRLGTTIVVENRAGASGIPAHQAAATADPDGYTFLFTNTSGLASNLVTFKKLPYDPVADFTPVALIVDLAPQMISVNATLPVKNLAELIAYAKANPSKVSYGADATAGAAVFAGRLLNKRSAAGIAEVAYRSAAQMVQDAASGVLPVLVSSIAVASPFIQTGQIRPIAVTSSSRFPSLPEVQAINETLPGVQMDGWFAVVAPKGVAPPIVEKVNAAIGEYLKLPATQKRLIDIGIATSGPRTPAATGDFIQQQQDGWRALAKELDIQAQ